MELRWETLKITPFDGRSEGTSTNFRFKENQQQKPPFGGTRLSNDAQCIT